MSATGSGDVTFRQNGYMVGETLARGRADIVFDRFGMLKELPKRHTDTLLLRRYLTLAPATTVLVEGVTPASTKLDHEDITIQLNQYGDVITITDKLREMNEDDVMREGVDVMSEQIPETLEIIRFNALKAGTNVFYENGAARASVNTKPTRATLRRIKASLRRQRAKMLREMLSSSGDFNTVSIPSSFIAVSHTDLESAWQDMPGFKAVEDYGNHMGEPNEIGTVDSTRIFLSNLAVAFPDAGGAAGGLVESTSGTSADVYPILVFAKDGYCVTPFAGERAVKPVMIMAKNSESDPLAQRHKIAWEARHAAGILNQNWLIRWEAAGPVA